MSFSRSFWITTINVKVTFMLTSKGIQSRCMRIIRIKMCKYYCGGLFAVFCVCFVLGWLKDKRSLSDQRIKQRCILWCAAYCFSPYRSFSLNPQYVVVGVHFARAHEAVSKIQFCEYFLINHCFALTYVSAVNYFLSTYWLSIHLKWCSNASH